MIWIDFSLQVGSEMKDEHPMLVLAPKAFNERTNILIGLPMTRAPPTTRIRLPSNSKPRRVKSATFWRTSQNHLPGAADVRDRTHGNKYRRWRSSQPAKN